MHLSRPEPKGVAEFLMRDERRLRTGTHMEPAVVVTPGDRAMRFQMDVLNPRGGIGLLVDQTSLSEKGRDVLEAKAREFLSIQPPLVLDIGLEQLSVALYEEDTLPRSSTRVWSLADPDLTAPALMEYLR